MIEKKKKHQKKKKIRTFATQTAPDVGRTTGEVVGVFRECFRRMQARHRAEWSGIKRSAGRRPSVAVAVLIFRSRGWGG